MEAQSKQRHERAPRVLIFWFQTTSDQHPLKPCPRLLLIHEDVLVARQEKRFKIQIPNSSYYGRKTFGSSVPKLEDDFWVFKYLPLSPSHLYCCWHSSGPGRVKGRPGDAFFRCALGEDVQTGPWLLPCSAEDTPKISRGQRLFLRFSFKAACGPRWSASTGVCFSTDPPGNWISLGVVKCEPAQVLLACSEETQSLDVKKKKKKGWL